MNIIELRNFLCTIENRRKAKISTQQKRQLTNAPFNGHICDLPTGVKTYHDMYWMCSSCRQYWHVQVVANTHRWQMFGQLPPIIIVDELI